jgi:hypothetical protein
VPLAGELVGYGGAEETGRTGDEKVHGRDYNPIAIAGWER